MTIKDPEIIKKVLAANEAKKKAYWESQGKREGRMVSVSKCKGCGIIMGEPGGTFKTVLAKDAKGNVVKFSAHVNCPGKKK
jgi:hypothetical protein